MYCCFVIRVLISYDAYCFVLHNTQIKMNNEEMLKRSHHCAASFFINSYCSEVMIFGGTNSVFSSGGMSDTAVLQLGKSLISLYMFDSVFYINDNFYIPFVGISLNSLSLILLCSTNLSYS